MWPSVNSKLFKPNRFEASLNARESIPKGVELSGNLRQGRKKRSSKLKSRLLESEDVESDRYCNYQIISDTSSTKEVRNIFFGFLGFETVTLVCSFPFSKNTSGLIRYGVLHTCLFSLILIVTILCTDILPFGTRIICTRTSHNEFNCSKKPLIVHDGNIQRVLLYLGAYIVISFYIVLMF